MASDILPTAFHMVGLQRLSEKKLVDGKGFIGLAFNISF
jgi:threonine dehydrogenase-like Zn-dependent dehydrogenase